MEHVILVYNPDGDIVEAVSPADPLNPQFSVDEIEALNPDQRALCIPVVTMTQHRQYELKHSS